MRLSLTIRSDPGNDSGAGSRDSMDVSTQRMDGRTVKVYDTGARGVPTVYASMYMEAGEAVLGACGRLGCPAFNLVTVSDLHWDEDLSPWPSEPVVTADDHFTGESDGYARYIDGEVIPYAESILGGSERVIAGYSMGGLFALYAPYVSDSFDRCVSGSGSVWFPNFVEYVESHDFRRVPKSVYLSIGDRESRTRNPYMKLTEGNTRHLCEFYRSKGIDSTFELNPGNHFKDADIRLAKGIAWTLTR